MAPPTMIDNANAYLYAMQKYLKKLRTERRDDFFSFFGEGNVTWEDTPTSYPCPPGLDCPNGRHVFTEAGCKTISCAPFVPYRERGYHPDDGTEIVRITRANRNSFSKWCFLDAQTIGKAASSRIPRYAPDAQGIFREYLDVPDVQKHVWAKLYKTDKKYKCFVENVEMQMICKLFRMDMKLPSDDDYDRLYDIYGRRALLDGMPLPTYNEAYCHHRVALSYDAKKMQCYRNANQIIVEEFLMGQLYREIWVSIHGFRR